MSRVIKFRFWSGTKMFHDLSNVMECLMQQQAFWIQGDGIKDGVIAYDHVGLHGAAFLQFTGMNDKNGKEIFEGDILEIYHWEYERKMIGKVIIGDSGPFLRDKDGEAIIFWDDGAHHWYNLSAFNPEEEGEAIGNVYENPELLNTEAT